MTVTFFHNAYSPDDRNNLRYCYLKVHVPYKEKLYENIDTYNSFVNEYKKHINEHNSKIKQSLYKDAGFDLLLPKQYNTNDYSFRNEAIFSMLMDLGVQCSMYKIDIIHSEHITEEIIPVSYFLFPRSSTGWGTPLRLANSAGIIDSGYRGNIKACIDNIICPTNSENPSILYNRGDRLFQLCAGDLSPILAELVTDLSNLDISGNSENERGIGGFGSTG